MARPRKPTQLHIVSGRLDHDRKRFADRVNEPKDERPLGDPPKHLRADQRRAWAEIESLVPCGVLCHADRLVVEVTATMLVAFRALGAAAPDAKVRRLESLLGQLGMTPATRSRVSATAAPRKHNDFAGIGRRP